MPKEPTDPSNPLVFLDIKIEQERVGRIIIELRKDVVPRTAENFRALCTGEAGIGTCGKSMHYKGVKFHKVQRVFMAQSGDVVKNDGSSGESIYGPIFEDENFILHHEEGAVSMANYSQPNTNNSQFFITSVNCSHLDGTNVVFGYVLRGLGIINEMEQYTTDEGVPSKEIVIEECGELHPGDNWNFCDKDETDDTLPPFPLDWKRYNDDLRVNEMTDVLNSIKNSGNVFYAKRNFVEARRKYRKSQRYYNNFKNKLKTNEERSILEQFYLINCINLAAVELHMNDISSAKSSCSEALRIEPNNVKALYRRGQADVKLKNYEEAIDDLRKALQISPDNKNILKELNKARDLLREYHGQQKHALRNLFK